MSQDQPLLRLLFLSTPVGPLGSGLGGGVELTLRNIQTALVQRGHQVDTVAPVGSMLSPFELVEIEGNLQITAQTQGRSTPITLPENPVLGNMWRYAQHVQANYDVILNFAYDWLPFYLTPWFTTPIAHLVSMGSLTEAMDQVIERTVNEFPGTIGVHSQAQADTFAFGDRCRCVGNGLDLSLYEFCDQPDPVLGWVGRIAPEKGLEDAIAAVNQTQDTLHIWGAISDADYWSHIQQTYPTAKFEYHGFLPTQELQKALRRCRALIMTPRWVEAFGNVAIEALTCGVPVIAYRRGGPTEIIEPGKTGWLVEPDSVAGLVEAIAKLDQIDRQTCRTAAEQHYSLPALGDRIERWCRDILHNHANFTSPA